LLKGETAMRGANAYQALNEAPDRSEPEPEPALHGRRYEALREAQQEYDFARQQMPQATLRLIEALEDRCTALERDLTEMRAAQRGPEPQTPERNEQAAIDRAFAPEPGDGPARRSEPLAPGELDDYVAPERWTERGGMVEQQASAMDWLKHSDEVRRERAGQDAPEPAAHELSQEDRQLLAAAQQTEAQTRQQERSQSQVHEPSGP
jgi:hypothetical protein